MMNNEKYRKMSKPQSVMLAMRLLNDLASYKILDVKIKRTDGQITGYNFWINSLDVRHMTKVEAVMNKALFVIYPHMGIRDDDYLNVGII